MCIRDRAQRAGLGWIGKHTNLINNEIGSWFFICEILLDIELEYNKPFIQDLCGTCTKCIDACPTNAITEPFVVNSNLCLAYHTIENRTKELPENITGSLGTWIAGCDICQEVCPWNHKNIPSTTEPDLQPSEWILNITKKDALSWSDSKWKENLKSSTLSSFFIHF